MNLSPRLYAISADIASLLARITIGQAFLQTGWGKLTHIERTTAFFADLGIPAPGFHAWAVGGMELIGGALLVLGLFTRPAALLLAGTMAVAILTADRGAFLAAISPWPDHGLTDVVPWMFLLPLLFLLAQGPGRLGLDQWCGHRCEPPEAGHPG